MLEREMKKFEKELENLKNGLNKKGCTKQYGKVYERLGRIKERNRSVHKYYDIKIDSDDGKITTLFDYKRNEKEISEKDSGVYYLRTNYTNLDETGIWEIYNTIREVESTFRCLKTDLKLRPVYHQKDLYSDAHLHLGLLSYHIVSVIRYMLKEAGIHYSWTKIVDVMGKHKSVVITMKNKKNESVIIKKCSKPEKEQLEIYRALKMSSLPYRRKKFVVSH